MAELRLNVEATLANAESVEALAQAAERLQEICEDQPWNETAREALRNLRQAAQGIRLHASRHENDGAERP